MKLSIVTTLYYSEPFIREFYHRITSEAKKISDSYEIIFVNDGSPDQSLQAALELHKNDSHVKVFDLSRNFGHHKAIMTGLAHSKGDYVFLIDVDLEEQPEWMGMFWKEMESEPEHDVVYGVQDVRKGKWFERVSGNFFFGFFNSLSDTKIARNIVLTRLMARQYVDNLVQHTERELVFAGLCALTGFRQKGVTIKKLHKGSTTYHLNKRIDMAINFLVSFSSRPLVYIFYLGMFITFISILAMLAIVAQKIFYGAFLGWTSIITTILFIGGIIIFSIGIVGIYLSKIFIEVKNRPYTIVRKAYE
jgi:putative glycosyltransferase